MNAQGDESPEGLRPTAWKLLEDSWAVSNVLAMLYVCCLCSLGPACQQHHKLCSCAAYIVFCGCS
jgi:hypothetical protein